MTGTVGNRVARPVLSWLIPYDITRCEGFFYPNSCGFYVPHSINACLFHCFLIFLPQPVNNQATGLEARKSTSGQSALRAVFLCPYAIAHLLWAGSGGEASACRDLVPRSSNPAICPPTPFGSGERVNQTVQGALQWPISSPLVQSKPNSL